jgi:hypothetical protein
MLLNESYSFAEVCYAINFRISYDVGLAFASFPCPCSNHTTGACRLRAHAKRRQPGTLRLITSRHTEREVAPPEAEVGNRRGRYCPSDWIPDSRRPRLIHAIQNESHCSKGMELATLND